MSAGSIVLAYELNFNSQVDRDEVDPLLSLSKLQKGGFGLQKTNRGS